MKVWFITGTSKGFGHIWARAALARGDKVAATARNTDSLADLVDGYGENVLPLALDVTDKAAVDAAVKQAHEHFGRLDVVVNNAGYGLFGTVEEVSEEQARAQIETNLFGALWVTKAALPILREQGSGHIIQVSSIGGVNAFPILGMYHASKWGLEGFRPLTWEQVKHLDRQGGWIIGSHTRRHFDCGSMDAARLESEIRGSKADLESQVADETRHKEELERIIAGWDQR